MTDSENGDRWLVCGECNVPVRVVRGRFLRITCPECGREIVYSPNGAQPAGGEVDELPPFLARRVGVSGAPDTP